MKKSLFTFYFYAVSFGLLFTFSLSQAQVVYEPVNSDVYPFLQRLAQKGVIEYNDLVIPLSRKEIAQKLIDAKEGKRYKEIGYRLTDIDKEELEFWLKDFGMEVELIGNEYGVSNNEISNIPVFQYLSGEFRQSRKKTDPNFPTDSLYWFRDSFSRYRLFSYSSDLFKINLDPIFGVKYGGKHGDSYKYWWNGFATYGYASFLGFSFDFRDNHESGKYADAKKTFTPETGVTVSLAKDNSFDYSEYSATLGIDWEWGEFSVNKGFLEWGYGYKGKLVLSNKAPSFPYLRLDLYPADWIRFNYLHAWLASDVIDSTSLYSTYRENVNRTIYRDKYLASHTLTLSFLPNLKFSLGESVIYSDKLEFLYLFPLSFFRAADHYLSNTNNDAGANSQFFFNISARNIIPNAHIWAEYLIDEITLSDLGDPTRERTQHAFALGGSYVDLFIPNLDIKLSYTKIYPFVYKHYIPTQTYESRGYALGHWMGHNADQWYMEIGYRVMRGLQTKLWAEYIRKGGDGVVDDQYKRPQPPFLFGERKNYTNWGFEAKYQITHELFARLNYQSNVQSFQQPSGTFKDERFDEMYFWVYYGM